MSNIHCEYRLAASGVTSIQCKNIATHEIYYGKGKAPYDCRLACEKHIDEMMGWDGGGDAYPLDDPDVPEVDEEGGNGPSGHRT